MGKGYRQGRLGEEIKKLISDMLFRELKDPRLADRMISVTGVDVTRDGSYATCYVTILDLAGDPEVAAEQEAEVMEGLKRATGRIRKEIGANIRLRRVPELIFKIDKSMEYGNHIDQVIRELGIDKDE